MTWIAEWSLHEVAGVTWGESLALAALFSSPVRSFAVDGCRSINQLAPCLCKVIPLLDEVGFEIWSWKWKQKDRFAHEQWWKIRGIQNRRPEIHGSILRCLGPTIVQHSQSFRCKLCIFTAQYNVHYDNRKAGHLLSALRSERCTSAIIFSHNKMAQKNHRIARQCTFKVIRRGDGGLGVASRGDRLLPSFVVRP